MNPSRSSGHEFVAYPWILVVCSSQSEPSRRTQLVVRPSRRTHLSSIHHDVLDLFPLPQGRLNQVSCATKNAILDRPPVIWHPARLEHSCISLWAKCFVPMSAGFSTPDTFTMINSRRATASCTLKTWVWRCLTPRLEAVAYAVASTRTRGFTTFAMSAAMATAPRALDALLVNA